MGEVGGGEIRVLRHCLVQRRRAVEVRDAKHRIGQPPQRLAGFEAPRHRDGAAGMEDRDLRRC